MAKSMKDLITDGKTNVTDVTNDAVTKGNAVGDDYKGVATKLDQIPDGIDADLLKDVEAVGNAAKTEAQKDIDDLKSTQIENAKKSYNDIKGNVDKKITDNNKAVSTLSSIESKYAKNQITNAKTSIEGNTKLGEDLKKDLEKAIADSAKKLDEIKNSIK